jgi:putative lipoprotein
MPRRPSAARLYSYLSVVALLAGCEQREGSAPTPPVESAPTAPTAAAEPLPTGVWHLVTLQLPREPEIAIEAGPQYTIEFAAGRVSGQADCNRYTTGYEQPSAGRLRFGLFAATLAACPPPSRAPDFMRVLGTATRYEIRGERLVLTADDGGVLTFAREAPLAASAALAPEVGRTFVFECAGDLSFTVRTGADEVAVWAPRALGGRYSVLSLTRAASGARYEEGDFKFWNKGELATFELAGQTYTDCRSNPRQVPWADAARRGATFRALGNEPSWNLEVHRDRLVLVTDLGAERAEFAYAEPEVAGARTTYRSAGGELVAVIERQPCVDTMSGEGFEASAIITVAAGTLRGCGRFL